MIVFMFWCFQNNKKTVLILLRFKMTSRASTVVQTTQCFSPALQVFVASRGAAEKTKYFFSLA